MPIDFSDPAVLMFGGRQIPIDTDAEYQAAIAAVSQVYSARPGGSFDADAQADLDQRVRSGQTLDQVVANAYDDAARRFPLRDLINNERDTALDMGRDAQLGLGPQYVASPTDIQRVYTAAGITAVTAQAAAIPSRQLHAVVSPERQLATQTARPMMNAGPASMIVPRQAGTLGGLSMGWILVIVGVGIAAWTLLRK